MDFLITLVRKKTSEESEEKTICLNIVSQDCISKNFLTSQICTGLILTNCLKFTKTEIYYSSTTWLS